MIRLVILGQPFWGRRLKDLLDRRRGAVEAVFATPRALLTPAGLGAAARADLFLRVGYRPGSPTWRGRAFDGLWSLLRALNPRAKGAHYWIGTDVMNTLQDFRADRLRLAPMARAHGDLHWADAPWLVEELGELGLASRCVPLPVPPKDLPPPERLPSPFTVLTYIPDARPALYDGPSIHRAAERLPELRFEVIGGTGAWVDRPLPNLTFFGWQPEVRPFLARASVLVRLVAHDGLGGTVREALEAGLHVLYSHPMPWVTRVPYRDPDALEAALRDLHRRHAAGELRPNRSGHLYVKQAFDLETTLDTYLADLRAHLGAGALP